jgi:hypothetical protein
MHQVHQTELKEKRIKNKHLKKLTHFLFFQQKDREHLLYSLVHSRTMSDLVKLLLPKQKILLNYKNRFFFYFNSTTTK